MTEDDINKAETLIGFLEYYVKKPWIDGMREIVVGSIEEAKEWVEKAKLTRQPTVLYRNKLVKIVMKWLKTARPDNSDAPSDLVDDLIKTFGQPTGLVPDSDDCIGLCDECDKHFSAEEMEHFKDDKWGHKCKMKNYKQTHYCESYIKTFGQPRVVLPKRKTGVYGPESHGWNLCLDAIKELNPNVTFKEWE